MIDEHDLAAHRRVGGAAQVVDAVEGDHFAGHAGGAGRGRIAERGDDQPLREGGDDLGALGPAHPHRHVIGFGADVGKAHRAQPGHAPIAGARLGLGARGALADLGGQSLDDVHGVGVVIERGVAQRGDLRRNHRTDRRQGRRRRGARRLRGDDGGGGEEKRERGGAEGGLDHGALLSTPTPAVTAVGRKVTAASCHGRARATASGRPTGVRTGRGGGRSGRGRGHCASSPARTASPAARPTAPGPSSG